MNGKRIRKSSSEENGGVWLDTRQLKEKAKQKMLLRPPISKLLNPFAECGGFSLAVALSFTQTKMDMPKTKQSSISSFFVPQRRILNKMSSEAPAVDTLKPTVSSISDEVMNVVSATKRKREMDIKSDHHEDSVVHKRNGAILWDEGDQISHSPGSIAEELIPPERERKFIETSSFSDDSQLLPLAWSQDPSFTCSQDSDMEFNLSSQNCTPAGFFQMDVQGRTSIQKSFGQVYDVQIDEKENRSSPGKSLPLCHLRPPSTHECTEPKTASPLKNNYTEHLWKNTVEESLNSQLKWPRQKSLNLKKLQHSRDEDEDSLTTLFTQDSEGFRVIAHRGLQARSPLKDHSNINTRTTRTPFAFKSLVEESEDEEVLFTQDTQGNMVIKH